MVGMLDGLTVVPDAPREEGEAILKMPDGQEIKLPVLLDSAGAQFVDIRKLQPGCGSVLLLSGMDMRDECTVWIWDSVVRAW